MKTKKYLGLSLIVVIVFSLIIAGFFWIGTGAANADDFVVKRVIDGDTIVVRAKDSDKDLKVRLLNVNTPELSGNEYETCYGKEAKKYLEQLLPKNTLVRLSYDTEKYDKYGRTLAAVTRLAQADNKRENESLFINLALAKNGYALPMKVGNNTKYYDEIVKAANEAKNSEIGIYDKNLSCTPTAQLASVTQEAEKLASDDAIKQMSAADLATAAASLLALSKSLDEMERTFINMKKTTHYAKHYTKNLTLDSFRTVNNLVLSKINSVNAEKAQREESQKASLEAAKNKQKELSTQKTERPKATNNSNGKQNNSERRKNLNHAKPATPPSASTHPTQPKNTPTKPKTRPETPQRNFENSKPRRLDSGKYTGCRAYGGKFPPNAIDKKGRPYTKIDCKTKLPIG